MSHEDAPLATSERIVLPYRGLRVERIAVDFRLILQLGQEAEVAIETPAVLSMGSVHGPDASPVQLVPETGDVASALALLHTEVLSSVAFHSGALRMVFSSGHHLNVAASEQYEAWTTAGPGNLMCISLPGGSLAYWSQT